jgi:serine/threonine-protein kinase HipA
MIVEVRMFGKPIGVIEWNNQRNSSVFQYNSEFISNAIEPSPIVMPKKERIFETNRNHKNFHDLPYLLSDSMPDDFGNSMMKEWLRRRNITFENINPVDRLTYVGKRGMGALEYEPINYNENDSSLIVVSQLLEVASKVIEGKKEISYNEIDNDSLTDILRIGTSVGGARAKALIAIRNKNNGEIAEIRPGDIIQPDGFTYWLLKIDGANQKTLGESAGLGKIEYAYYKLALASGIEMTDSKLYEENNRFHFMTQRFDREKNSEKIHVQTFGALSGIDYRVQKASSYESLFRVMKMLQLSYNQFEQQYRRLLFNVMARNHDDHVKNFSFLMNQDGNWRISPAYDLTYQYSEEGSWTNVHQSSINGKFDLFTKEDVVGFAKKFGIKKAEIILEEVIDAVSNWRNVAVELDIPRTVINKIQLNLRINEFLKK